jgi:hypothetical protein
VESAIFNRGYYIKHGGWKILKGRTLVNKTGNIELYPAKKKKTASRLSF